MESHPLKTNEVPSAHLGFGLLRIDPASAVHREAILAAANAGVRTFDFGRIRDALPKIAGIWPTLRPFAEAAKPLHFILRTELGEAKALEIFLSILVAEFGVEFNHRTQWTVLLSDPEFELSRFSDDHSALYQSLHADFLAFEALATEKKIFAYGVGSAAFTYPKEDPQYLSLEALLTGESGSAKTGARPLHFPHFSALEFPLNLYESAAYLFQNQSLGDETVSLLHAAKHYGLRTFARRPLDALTETQLLRLVAYPDHHRVDLNAAVMRTLEVALARETEQTKQGNLVPWAHRLRDQLRHVNDPEQWKEILKRKINPDLDAFRRTASHEAANGNSEATPYLEAMEALLLSVQLWCEKNAAERNERIRAKIVSAVPALRLGRFGPPPTLVENAFQMYRSVPGLDVILVGMRNSAYVTEAVRGMAPSDVFLSADELANGFYAAHESIHGALAPETSPEGTLH